MDRPNPDILLEKIKNEEERLSRGQLKIFFGYAVGKTYSIAKWIALYVEIPSTARLALDEQKQLNNLKLAKKLGGEIIVLHGENIIEQMLRIAKLRNVTKIVIGRNQSNNKKFSKKFKKDIVDKLIDEVDYIDIHIIPYKFALNIKYKPKKGKSSIKSKLKISKLDFLKLIMITLMISVLAYAVQSMGCLLCSLFLSIFNILSYYLNTQIQIPVCKYLKRTGIKLSSFHFYAISRLLYSL
ncbi:MULTISPECIES: hypothetical protein [unclassified Clostridioides]|uniref:hypothetical protein n=1 Tax=unclassified Clostridioides TaxID=2635829 RepID=UPI001D11AA55